MRSVGSTGCDALQNFRMLVARAYCTVKWSGRDWLVDPAATVTVSAYWPAGVPFAFVLVLVPVPPPHEQITIKNNKGSPLIHVDATLFLFTVDTTSSPKIQMDQNRGMRFLE